MVIFLNTLVIFLNSLASNFLPQNTHDFIIPFIEESSRLISLFLGPPTWLYTAYMSITEFLTYIHLIASKNENNVLTIYHVYIRTIIVLCHFSWYGIQYAAYKIYEITDEKKYLFYGFLTTYMIHVLWNYKLGNIVYILIKM